MVPSVFLYKRDVKIAYISLFFYFEVERKTAVTDLLLHIELQQFRIQFSNCNIVKKLTCYVWVKMNTRYYDTLFLFSFYTSFFKRLHTEEIANSNI